VTQKRVLLGDFLIDQGLITRDQLRHALRYQQDTGKLLGRCLVELGYLQEEELVRALSKKMGVQYVHLRDYKIDPEVINLVSEDFVRTYRLFPLFKIGNRLTVGMVNPLDVVAIDALARRTGFQIDPVICSEKDIEWMTERYYGPGGESLKGEASSQIGDILFEQTASDLLWIDFLLAQAVEKGARYLHIESFQGEWRLRFRIGEELQEVSDIPHPQEHPVIRRILAIAHVEINNSREPQEGLFYRMIGDQKIRCRVFYLPTSQGVRLVLVVDVVGQPPLPLEEAGISPKVLGRLEKLLQQPPGILVLVGPRDSGKSTTLHALLQRFAASGRSCVVLERWSKFQTEGIHQIDVETIGRGQGRRLLQQALQQDLDMVAIDGLQEPELLREVFYQALQGPLFLLTLNAPTAPLALAEILRRGVEPWQVASLLKGLLVQRVVGKLCPDCRSNAQIAPPQLDALIDSTQTATFFSRGPGCSSCQDTGYVGRTGIFGLWVLDEPLREWISAERRGLETWLPPPRSHPDPLLEDGLQKAREGLVAIDDILRLTPTEEG